MIIDGKEREAMRDEMSRIGEHRQAAPPPLSRRALYVDPRRFALAVAEVGLGLGALLVLDTVSSRVDGLRRSRQRRRNPEWAVVARHLDLLRGWIDDGLTTDRMHELLARRGVDVPARVIDRYATCYRAMAPAHGVDIDLTSPLPSRPPTLTIVPALEGALSA